jgi:hypothetical protein
VPNDCIIVCLTELRLTRSPGIRHKSRLQIRATAPKKHNVTIATIALISQRAYQTSSTFSFPNVSPLKQPIERLATSGAQ